MIGVEPFDDRPDQRTVIQCVNRAALTFAKAERDMSRAVAAPTGKPEAFKFVCRSAVSATMRDQISTAARALSIDQLEIWSGAEFEEHLRLHAELLLKRFVEGIVFPDAEAELRAFVDDFPDLSDDQALNLMAAVFDRPAFRTPFHSESYLPAFQRAIEDTIRAFNTGVWQTREGAEIRRIPSLHHLRSRALRDGMAQVVRELDQVRRIFKQRLGDGSIRHCGCDNPHCPTFMVSDAAAHALDNARTKALRTFGALHPGFDVRLA